MFLRVVDVYYCFTLYSYVPNPVLVIIDVQPKELGIPTKAYYAVEEVKEVGLESKKLFMPASSASLTYMFFIYRTPPRKVKRCLSMFLQKLLLMKLRKSVRLVRLKLHEKGHINVSV